MAALPTEYRQLVDRLHSRAAQERRPLNGTFELTERCNLDCRMCYVCRPAGDSAVRKKELSAEQWLSLAREAKEAGMLFLLLTGGEPFLRPDFFAIYEPLTRMGFVLTLFTNGTLITDAVAKRLAQAPPSRTEVTLYGATAATYEAITGVAGSYALCCRGIETLVKRRVPLLVKTTLTRQNIAELEAMRQMAHNWGVLFSAAWLLSKRRDRAVSGTEECRLPVDECIALEAADRASALEWTEAALREQLPEREKNFFCQAGRAAFVVTPSGEMNACLDLPMPAAKPLETGFVAAWEQVKKFVDAVPPVAKECSACDARGYCPRCPAWSYLETETMTEPVPYLCEIARTRKARYEKHA